MSTKTYNKNDIVLNAMYREIAQTSPISRKEEWACFTLYHQTDDETLKRKVREKIVKSNLRFALKYALQYINFSNIPTSDFYSEAKLGLIEAVDKFDHKRGIKFISFAVWHIKLHISKLLLNNDLIRIPPNKKHKLNKVLKMDNIEEELIKDPDLCHVYGISTGLTSIDGTVNDNGESFLHEKLVDLSLESPEKSRLRDDLSEQLSTIMNTYLSPEEAKVITLVHGLNGNTPLGLRDTSDIIGKSHERVRQLRDKAYLRLRKSIGTNALKEIFDEYVEH